MKAAAKKTEEDWDACAQATDQNLAMMSVMSNWTEGELAQRDASFQKEFAF